MKTFFFFLTLLSVCSCQNKPGDNEGVNDFINSDTIEKSHPKWMVYGIPSLLDKAAYEAARLMNFEFISVAGCIVSDSLKKAVSINNKATDQILTKKYGIDWYKLFEHKADSLYKHDSIKVLNKFKIAAE